MDIALLSDRLLTSSAPGKPEVELVWKREIETDRLCEVEMELLGSVLPELIAELMLTSGE